MSAFVGLHTEECRTPFFLTTLGDALDELINLAKPPTSLALPEHVHTAVIDWIEGWRKDVLEFATFERFGKRGRYSEFRQHIRNYTMWLQAGIDRGHAMHSDIFVAVMNTTFDKFAVRSKDSAGSWTRVQAFANRTGLAANYPADELGPESQKTVTLSRMHKEQPLESALARVASASLRASRSNAGRRSGGSSSYATEQLEKWLNAELVTMRGCSDQQLEDKAWLYGMLELLQRLEHACERSAGGQMGLLNNWRVLALLERNPCRAHHPAQTAYADYLEGQAFWAGPVPPQPATSERPEAVLNSIPQSHADNIKAALHALIEFAQPPTDLALPTHLIRQHINKDLLAWKEDMLAQVSGFRGANPKVYNNFAKRLVAYTTWFWQSLSSGAALHHDIYAAILATKFSNFCGPVEFTAEHRAAAHQHGWERPPESSALHADTSALLGLQHGRDKELERQYLQAAFKRAAMIAHGIEASTAGGLHLSRLPFESPSLNNWAEAGIKAVDEMSNEALTAGWVYGMLELLERLARACGKSTDKHARKNFLLVSAH